MPNDLIGNTLENAEKYLKDNNLSYNVINIDAKEKSGDTILVVKIAQISNIINLYVDNFKINI